MKKEYNGVIVPMITPVTKERKPDDISVTRLCRYFEKYNVSVFLLGTTGESPSVNSEESRGLIKMASKVLKGKVKLYAGITGNCINENIENARTYIELGADVIVSVLPHYYKLTPEEMFSYFKNLADALNFPLMIYNIPATTGMSIPLDVVEELSHHRSICGFKDSERDIERMEKSVATFRDRDDFSYFCGYAAISSIALKLGADGLVPSTANFVPGMFSQLYEYSKTFQWVESERMQRSTDEIASIYQTGRTLGGSIQALKSMMSVLGLCEPYAIPPLSDLSESEHEEIRNVTFGIVKKYKISNVT